MEWNGENGEKEENIIEKEFIMIGDFFFSCGTGGVKLGLGKGKGGGK